MAISSIDGSAITVFLLLLVQYYTPSIDGSVITVFLLLLVQYCISSIDGSAITVFLLLLEQYYIPSIDLRHCSKYSFLTASVFLKQHCFQNSATFFLLNFY